MTPPTQPLPTRARIERARHLLIRASRVVSEEADRQGRPLRWRLDSENPRTSSASAALRDASALVCEAAALVGHQVAATFTANPTPAPAPQPVASPGPTRPRSFAFPEGLPWKWHEITGRYVAGASPKSLELDRRRDTAISWSERYGPTHFLNLRNHGLRPGMDLFLLRNCRTVDWRTRHHLECASLDSWNCDCDMLIEFRIGAQVFRVAPEGSFAPITVAPLKRSDVIFHRERSSLSSDQAGFPDEYPVDESGKTRVPLQPHLEYCDGTISFTEGSIPQSKPTLSDDE